MHRTAMQMLVSVQRMAWNGWLGGEGYSQKRSQFQLVLSHWLWKCRWWFRGKTRQSHQPACRVSTNNNFWNMNGYLFQKNMKWEWSSNSWFTVVLHKNSWFDSVDVCCWYFWFYSTCEYLWVTKCKTYI